MHHTLFKYATWEKWTMHYPLANPLLGPVSTLQHSHTPFWFRLIIYNTEQNTHNTNIHSLCCRRIFNLTCETDTEPGAGAFDSQLSTFIPQVHQGGNKE